MDGNEIKERLASSVEEVCAHLFPRGRKESHEWCVGSLDGEPGKSLKISLNHGKAGVWCDFASGDKGNNLLELWSKARAVDYRTALTQAQQWLGVVSEPEKRFWKPARPVQKKPLPTETDLVPLDPAGRVSKYLIEDRKIDAEILTRYGVCQTSRGLGIVFPFKDETGERVVHIKRMALERKEGKKAIVASKGTQQCLFGKQTVKSGMVTICEGEIDAMSVAEIGGEAVSVPIGAKWDSGNDEWIDHDWNWLQQFHTINVLMDSDEPGKRAALSIIERLGKERCRLVTLPDGFKDANEMLMAGKVAELGEAIFDAKSLDPEELRNSVHYREKVWESIARKNQEPDGHEFVVPMPFRVRNSELTIWTGFSGHGKSALLNQLMVHLAGKGEKSCIASFEIQPWKTLEILVRQALRVKAIGRTDCDKAVDWLGQYIWLYHHVGTKNWREMLETFVYARRRYGISQFVVDSLLKVGIGSENYEGQKEFVDALTDFVNNWGGHVHLVAHSKKLEDESRMPSKMDVKGCSEITDMAFNGLTVWRNKRKEQLLYETTLAGEELEWQEADAMPDGKIQVWKQRETGDEPINLLFYSQDFMQFTALKGEFQRYLPAV